MGGLFGLAFAGSPAKLAEGVRIAGVDVGGMSPAEARLALEQHARSLQAVPVTFTAGKLRWQLGARKTSPPANQLTNTSESGSGMPKGSPYISVCSISK